ncbi:Oidioi.mRNA.OKI2018_I69.chr2.g7179.t1.cds [Oikopleura dioica]|uniref:Oidioi.mRNA.OKI2018_I69.chr2.g7179.t1.cds n=1 Tax=Oikopleura dioica TaxID=34765 RepID=A0ABN7TBE2_OIKDI|nr:Oidioi.mRNA.OKI2018_I69.chr2.g7179.t1.cds [Oikopleura dioica]
MSDENIGYLVNLRNDEISFASIDYKNLDIDDSCYSFMNGQHYIIGGYDHPRLILTLEVDKCELTEHDMLGIQHVDGMWGACAVYNDITYLCFDESGVDMYGCQTYDGYNQNLIEARTEYAHDWSTMAVYNDEMWTITNVGQLNQNLWAVQKFDGLTWTKIGELSESHSTVSTITSGKIINGFAYTGKYYLDKVKMDEEDYSATNLGKDPDGSSFVLYYAPMLLVDGPICAL